MVKAKQIKYIIFHIHINPSIVENIRSQRFLTQLKYYSCAISTPKRQILEKWTLNNPPKEREKYQKRQSTKSHCMPASAAAFRERLWEEQMLVPGTGEARSFHQ